MISMKDYVCVFVRDEINVYKDFFSSEICWINIYRSIYVLFAIQFNHCIVFYLKLELIILLRFITMFTKQQQQTGGCYF